jgi:flavodoxin
MIVSLFFASTSGKTRTVFDFVVSRLTKHQCICHELGDTAPSALFADLVILGTPSYGKGDWHQRWEENAWLLDQIQSPVALVGLGDERFHGKTFGGGLHRLTQEVQQRNLHILGEHWRPVRCSSRTTCTEEYWNGLMLDLRLERTTWRDTCSLWLERVMTEPKTQ